jgi:predicted transcriptional regulator
MRKVEYEDMLINNLVKAREKEVSDLQKKVSQWLSKKSYFEKPLEDKKEFLLTKEGILLIESLAKKDLSLVQIANTLEITQRDLHAFSRENPEIYDAIDRGREQKENLVVEALYAAAQDRYIEEETIFKTKSGRSDRESEKIQTYKKFIPANFRAIEYILNSKRSMEYRRKAEEDLLDENKPAVFVIKIAGDVDDGNTE